MIVEQRLALLEERRAPKRRYPRGTRRKPRGKKVAPPRGLQLSYARVLQGFVAEFEKALREEVLDQLPTIVPRQDSRVYREDNTAREVQLLIEALRERISPVFSDELLERVSVIASEKVRARNLSQILAQLEAMGVGAGTFTRGVSSGLAVDELQELFVRTNTQLIKTLQGDMLSKAEGAVLRGVRSGLRHEEIRKELMKDVGTSYKRARLIARDQVSKLNSEMTRTRHLEAGITSYEWVTNIDGRERISHADNNGKIFRYDDPPPTGHPGEEVNCRCQAVPVLPSIDR